MKNERLARILGLIDADLIEESGQAAAPRRRVHWGRWGALAACLCVAALGAWAVMGGLRMGAAAPGDSYGGGDTADGRYTAYAGPVLPLSFTEETPDLSARRDITLDFAAWPEAGAGSACAVTDSYVLRNDGDTDLTCTALYPFTGSLQALAAGQPAITVDGAAVETALYAGGGQPTEPDCWDDYAALLADGSYRAEALEALPELTEPVVVYELTNDPAPEGYDAATMAIRFAIDPEQTRILTYDINGGRWGDDGQREYSYFVKEWNKNGALLIVLGADIGEYSLQGYQDGGCAAGEELNIAGAVTRRETTLGQALELVVQRWLNFRTSVDDLEIPDAALLYQVFARHLLDWGPAGGADGYQEGMLDSLLQYAQGTARVFYLAFEVTVPAGGEITVTAALDKAVSFNHFCSDPARQGVYGCELASALGSTLRFSAQTATLENGGAVEIVDQNFGFDPAGGVTTVTLDPDVPRFYLTLRRSQ